MGNAINKNAAKIQYTIFVKTADTARAGTDADIHIQFIGAKRKLISTFHHFEQGEFDKFVVQMEDIGDPLLCKLTIRNQGFSPDWKVDYIEVECNHQKYFFPIYEWTNTDHEYSKDYYAVGGVAVLPSANEAAVLKKFREEYLKNKMSFYKWRPQPNKGEYGYGFPGILDTIKDDKLPRNAQWTAERTRDNIDMAAIGASNLLLNKFVGVFDKFDNLNQVQELLRLPSLKNKSHNEAFWDNWQEDKEFAREQINGCRPRGVKRVDKKVPEGFHVTDNDIVGLLPAGKTIKSEIKRGRIFIVDNSIMEDIPSAIHPILKKQTYTCAPYLLLHCVEEGYLMPLAIQFWPNKKKSENPVWTPNDLPNQWLLAKMYFNNANDQLQQIREHLLLTHLVIEPFGIALRRRLSKNHPIYRLLFPHLHTTSAINHEVKFLINGVIDKLFSIGAKGAVKLLQQEFKKFDLSEFNFPEQLKKRGVDDPKIIKEYGYRDDGLKYWAAIKKYVHGIIDIFYESDKTVRNDQEIQNWIFEVRKFGFANAPKSIPESINSIDELEALLTSIIFNCSVQHTVEGVPLFDTLGNPANHPALMRLPPPTDKKEDITMDRIMDTLPVQDLMSGQIAASYLLSTLPEDEVLLGKFPMKLFVDKKPKAVLEQFSLDVQQIGDSIQQRIDRNKWAVRYDYLLPKNIPCRIDF